jgi:hypothetical protein
VNKRLPAFCKKKKHGIITRISVYVYIVVKKQLILRSERGYGLQIMNMYANTLKQYRPSDTEHVTQYVETVMAFR